MLISIFLILISVLECVSVVERALSEFDITSKIEVRQQLVNFIFCMVLNMYFVFRL